MTPAQCRAARKLLDWSAADLARAAGVSVITVRKFEGVKVAMNGRTSVSLMRRALEGAGVRFGRPENGEGSVRLGSRAP
jgi:transcriptional regulator with XRE-family HTH domain